MTWPQVVLGDVVQFARSGIAPEGIEAGTRYVGLEHIDNEGNFVGVRAVASGELASTKFNFSDRHVLFGKLRPYLKKTARPSFAGVCSTDILPLMPRREIDRDYLFHALRWQRFVDEVTSLCAGANLPRISPKVLASLKIALPPLTEQRRIATILDKADALRAKRREAIAQLDQLLQSVFHDMFGGAKASSKKWPTSPLGELMEIKWGNTSITKESYVAAGVPAYSASGCDGFLTHAEHDGEGIVLSAIGARCGKCFYVGSGPWTAIKNTITLRPFAQSRVDLRYVMQLINDERFWPSRGGGQPFIALGAARNQMIQMPPIELQSEFSKRTVKIERLRCLYQLNLHAASKSFESLQHRAFSGGL